MYKPVPRGQIADALVHLRELFRKTNLSTEMERLAHERREVVTKNLLSNLFRTKEHPTLHAVLELADIFSLTIDGAHRLFGYELEEIREYDSRLNGGRTHIIESYPFERDLSIDLPFRLGNPQAFGWNTMLTDLVQEWQTDIPIRALEEEGWHRPGAYYVHVGTEDVSAAVFLLARPHWWSHLRKRSNCVPTQGRFTCFNSATVIGAAAAL